MTLRWSSRLQRSAPDALSGEPAVRLGALSGWRRFRVARSLSELQFCRLVPLELRRTLVAEGGAAFGVVVAAVGEVDQAPRLLDEFGPGAG